MSKYFALVGPASSGKSTLMDVLNGETRIHSHREDCEYRSLCVELPASYIENHWMHPHIVVICNNHAKEQVFLLSAKATDNPYSAAFAKALPKETVGVVTHIDEATADEVKRAQRWLMEAGCSEVFAANLLDKTAHDALRQLVVRGCATCVM